MLDTQTTLDCHIREPDPQIVSCALRVRNVPQAISEDVLLELFNQVYYLSSLNCSSAWCDCATAAHRSRKVWARCLQGGHVEQLETFEAPPGSLGVSQARRVTCKVRYCTVASSLSAFVMFYHTLVLRGQALMVDFWQPETPTEKVTVPKICTQAVLVRPTYAAAAVLCCFQHVTSSMCACPSNSLTKTTQPY